MKTPTFDTTILWLKFLGFVGAAYCTSLGGSLAQWSNSDIAPTLLQWYTMHLAALGTGFTAMLAFWNTSAADYNARRANPLPPSPQPQTKTPEQLAQ